MKRLMKIALMGAFALGATTFNSCDKGGDDNPPAGGVSITTPTSQTAFADQTSGGSVNFTARAAWTVSAALATRAAGDDAAAEETRAAGVPWLHFMVGGEEKYSGAAGTVNATLALDPNYTGAERKATITISADGDDATVTVTQKATKEDGQVPTPQYTVTFDTQGGSAVEEQGVAHGGKVAKPSADPTREGYTFTNWYSDAACTTLWDFAESTVTSDITLYAGWQDASVPQYTVTFDTQGGSAVDPQNVPEGGKATAPAAAPTREDHAFTGWFADAAATNPWDFAENTVTSDVTIYAGWQQAVTWTVTFRSPGGSAVNPVIVADGESVAEPTAPTWTPFIFGGWYTEEALVNAYDFGTAVTADLDLYAKWDGMLSKPTLLALINEYQAEVGSDPAGYTTGSWDAYQTAFAAAVATYQNENASPVDVTMAWHALQDARNNLVAVVDEPVSAISVTNPPLGADDETFTVEPGGVYDLNAFGVDAAGVVVADNAVNFGITLPSWITFVGSGENNYAFSVAANAAPGSSVMMTITSAADANVSRMINIAVADNGVAEAKAAFIAAVDALPNPENVTYTHYVAIETAWALYQGLYQIYNPDEDPDLTDDIAKLEACAEALWDLPSRVTYSFSGDVATITPIGYDGNPLTGETRIMNYVMNGSFPNGTLTSTTWIHDPDMTDKGYYQYRITFIAGGTFTEEFRDATDANGTGASAWEQEGNGTYTFTGSQTDGGTMSLTYEG